MTAERPGNSKGFTPIRPSHQKVSFKPSKLPAASRVKAKMPTAGGEVRAMICQPGPPMPVEVRGARRA